MRSALLFATLIMLLAIVPVLFPVSGLELSNAAVYQIEFTKSW
jgi:hypothetical protein